jgi:hypothetical protein
MGIFDLYQQYLTEAYAPKQTTSTFDPYKYLLYPPVQDDGDSTTGITTLSPQQTKDRAMQMEFDAAASMYAKDQYGNMVNTGKVVGGLTEEEQLLMDRMRGKGPLTTWQKANLGLGFLGPATGGISNILTLGAMRYADARKAAEEMEALQRQEAIRTAIRNASSGSGGSDTFSFSDNSGYGGTGTSSPSNVGPGGTLGGGV